MGLLDKLKKKRPEDREKLDTEMIGGLLADAPPPLSDLIDDPYLNGLPGLVEPFTQGLPANAGGLPQEEKRRSDDIVSSMDIFTQETAAGDDGFNLADRLEDIDLAQLLVECRDVAARLRAKKEANS